MENKTLEKRVSLVAEAYGFGEYAHEITSVIETLMKREDLDVKEVISDMIDRLKNGDGFDGLIPKKKRAFSQETIDKRYEKQLEKLNKKYGRI